MWRTDPTPDIKHPYNCSTSRVIPLRAATSDKREEKAFGDGTNHYAFGSSIHFTEPSHARDTQQQAQEAPPTPFSTRNATPCFKTEKIVDLIFDSKRVLTR